MKNECVVAVYESLIQAEKAVYLLDRSKFPRNQISLVKSHLPADSKLIGEFKLGDDSPGDAAVGAGLGGLLGVLGGASMASVMGLGMVFFLGPIGFGVVGAAVGAFVGAMSGWGVHEARIRHYEQCLAQGQVLVIAHGNPLELGQSLRILEVTDATEVQLHARDSSDAPEVSAS